MPTYRTAYRYHFKLGNRIVYTGITGDVQWCEYEHKQTLNWEKGHLCQVGDRTFLQVAIDWEYQQTKNGKPTKSNLTKPKIGTLKL